MSYKDTLALYDDLVAGGCTEAQARVQAKQLGGVAEAISEHNDVMRKIEKDLFWLRIIGGAMALAFLSNWFR